MWQAQAIRKLIECLKLDENWDSYGAPKIEPAAALEALDWLHRVMIDGITPPSIVPTNRGGIALEWHVGGVDLEVDILGNGSVNLDYNDSGGGEDAVDQPLDSDWGEFTAMLLEMCKRKGDTP